MSPRLRLLAASLALLAASAALPAGCSGGTDAQGPPPPCSGDACACDDLFTPLGQCLDVSLMPSNAQGQFPCVVVEANDEAPCLCNGPGRSPVSAAHMCAVSNAMAASTMTWSCFCEIEQLTGAHESDCQENEQPSPLAQGWCYVDASGPSSIGNPDLVKSCPTGEKRMVRLVGTGTPPPSSSLFLACGQ